MTEIKTDMGFARAFIRLALERKLLHSHLRTILNDRSLLRELYKKYAFLRGEDEREQFIFHVMSLNAVDFSCFTHTFISTRVQYEVLIVSTLDRFNSASVWITCSGTLATTSFIKLPPNSLQFTFDVSVERKTNHPIFSTKILVPSRHSALDILFAKKRQSGFWIM